MAKKEIHTEAAVMALAAALVRTQSIYIHIKIISIHGIKAKARQAAGVRAAKTIFALPAEETQHKKIINTY